MLVVPPIGLALLFLIGQAVTDPRALSLEGLLGTAVMFAWPGYAVFLLFGVPVLYLLFRRNRTEIVIFLLVGAFCTCLPWLVAATMPNPHDPSHLRNILRGQIPWFALLGLFDGFLTWLIVLGFSANPKRERNI